MLKPEAIKILYVIGPMFGHAFSFSCSPPILPPNTICERHSSGGRPFIDDKKLAFDVKAVAFLQAFCYSF